MTKFSGQKELAHNDISVLSRVYNDPIVTLANKKMTHLLWVIKER